MNWSLAHLALNVAAPTFAVVCIFDGVRRISTLGLSKSALISTAFGFLYCVGYAGFSYWGHNFQHETSTRLHKGLNIPVLAVDWGINFPPQQRAKTSLEFAQAAFSIHGQLRYYFDETGKRLLFVPTQSDLNQREKKVAELAQLDYVASESAKAPARWLLIAILAAFFGFGWGKAPSLLTNHSSGLG